MLKKQDQPGAIAAWIALHITPGVGSVTIKRLVDRFGSPEAVLNMDSALLKDTGWLSPRARNAILSGPDPRDLERSMDTIKRLDAWVMTYRSEDYPPLLRQIPDPPALLYGLGDRARLTERSIAIVGSRKATPYGIKAARGLASGLAEMGMTVVSGLAPGIDTAAHEAALEAGGVTIAVKGCGIDIPYPRHNEAFLERLRQEGAIITEFPPGVTPEPKNFPMRNRVISGLCLGVVIVEAGLKSGSLITASCALEQGREVMAVPGSIYSNTSLGSHWLIKQGARLVENASDVMDGLGVFKDLMPGPIESKRTEGPAPSLESEERLLYERLCAYPIHVDEIANLTGLPISKVSAILLQMELKDIVQALPGQMYQRK
ncbi:MAG: DNA-processing protein DprA [Desulfobacteraceae bacterium]|nr:DNA-processing protein DprA [Desulfobacteraceae bacterium]